MRPYVDIFASVVCMHALVSSSAEVYDFDSVGTFCNSMRLFLLR